jgi:hypothetical protein
MTNSKWSLRILAAMMTFTLGGFALAQTTPPGLPASLATVDEYLGTPDWAKGFGKSQSLEGVFDEKMLPKFTDSSLHFQVKVEPTSASTALISTLKMNGDKTSESTLNRIDWDTNHGNWIRMFIAQTESYGYRVTIDEVTPIQMQVRRNGTPVTVEALQVLTSGKSAVTTIQQRFVITKEIPGAGGLLVREETQKNGFGRIRRTQQILDVKD